eukprot:scaffold250987_cov32-Tisochrysis_lutea.AAC.3
MDKCRARINIIAPIDTEIYEGVKADLDARIASYGPSFARRLAALRAARKAYGAKESEMKRRSSQPYHKFDGGWEVQKESLNMSRLRCPLGDSWAAVRVCRHVRRCPSCACIVCRSLPCLLHSPRPHCILSPRSLVSSPIWSDRHRLGVFLRL